jgi:hypothetical protein
MGPPPITTRCVTAVLLSKIVSLVKYGASARPGIGGTAGEEPVAMTKRRAVIR